MKHLLYGEKLREKVLEMSFHVTEVKVIKVITRLMNCQGGKEGRL